MWQILTDAVLLKRQQKEIEELKAKLQVYLFVITKIDRMHLFAMAYLEIHLLMLPYQFSSGFTF